MQYELCRHIKTNGLRCQDAALTEATRGYLIPGQHIELTALEDHEEDHESVQVSLGVVTTPSPPASSKSSAPPNKLPTLDKTTPPNWLQ